MHRATQHELRIMEQIRARRWLQSSGSEDRGGAQALFAYGCNGRPSTTSILPTFNLPHGLWCDTAHRVSRITQWRGSRWHRISVGRADLRTGFSGWGLVPST